MPRSERFRFKNVLAITEAPEAKDVLWCELDTTFLQSFLSMLETVAALAIFVGIAVSVLLGLQSSPWCVGISVAILNIAVTPVMFALTARERHQSKASEHVFLLIRLIVTRWIISVGIHKMIVPFEETLTQHNVMTIRAILLSDMLIKPIINLLDLPGCFDHYIIAMFSQTQEKMNRLFLGAHWSLAERYSSMSTSIFICLSYSALYPYAYFICAVANLLTFFSDKFCLLRVWRQVEPEDATITAYYRSSLAVAFLAHMVFTLWYWSDWPFDRYCPTAEKVSDVMSDNLSFELQDKWIYKECTQQHEGVILEIRGGRRHMTESQVSLIFIYKIFTVFASLLVAIAYFGSGIYRWLKDIFVGFVPSSRPVSDVRFSKVEFIEGYVPGLVDPFYEKPLLACDITTIDSQHIHWEGNWEAYNLNSEHDLPGMKVSERSNLFSSATRYPVKKGGPNMTYHMYMQQNYPHMMERLLLDKGIPARSKKRGQGDTEAATASVPAHASQNSEEAKKVPPVVEKSDSISELSMDYAGESDSEGQFNSPPNTDV